MAGNHVQLSRRLKAIADMVTEGNRLVDVGCDHGYLPVYLMLNHKIPGAIATDVGKGPLARAQEHIAQYGMSKYIEARLCDGLQGVRTGEGDTLVIAGMGGPLMEKILTEGKAALPGFRELILHELFLQLPRCSPSLRFSSPDGFPDIFYTVPTPVGENRLF